MAESTPAGTPTLKGVKKKRLATGWKVLIGIVAALLVLWVAGEIVIPIVASSYVKNEIKKKYPDAKSVSVSISAFPAIRLAFKDYSSLTVKVRGITLEDINFDSIVLRSKGWPDGKFEAVVLPAEIMRFFSATHSYVQQPALALDKGSIQVTGKINIGYATVSVTAAGKLEPRQGKQVYFVPSNIAVLGVSNASKATSAVQEIMTANPVFVVRSDLPFDVTSITVSNDMLRVMGTVDLSRALNIKL